MENIRNKKQSVGLIIFTDIPNIGFVALLRERGFFNFEKMELESWYGSYQPTIHGKLEKGEITLDALYRETAEELGIDFVNYLKEAVKNDNLKIIEVFDFNGEKENIKTFATKIDFSHLKNLRLSPDGGIIKPIKKNEADKICDIKLFDKFTGIADRNIVAMFSDDKKALIEGFKHFT